MITHAKVSAKVDGADNTLIQPSDWNDEHTIAEGYFLPRVKKVTLTNSQIKALPSTPVEIIPAPGEGKFIFPMFAVLRVNSLQSYTNINASARVQMPIGGGAFILLKASEDPDGLVSGILANGNSVSLSASSLSPTSAGGIEMLIGYNDTIGNLPLNIEATNAASGDFTGGDVGNSLEITVYYVIADL